MSAECGACSCGSGTQLTPIFTCREHKILNLTIQQVRSLDAEMRNYYPTWVAESSITFRDPLFTYGRPITVSYCYGQNTPLVQSGKQGEAFHEEHDMRKIRYLDFAIASHPTCVLLNARILALSTHLLNPKIHSKRRT